MKVLSVIASGVLVSAVVVTAAHSMGRTGDPEYNNFIIKQVDADADGKITKKEFMEMSAKMAAKEFAAKDFNDNGVITAEEFHHANR